MGGTETEAEKKEATTLPVPPPEPENPPTDEEPVATEDLELLQSIAMR